MLPKSNPTELKVWAHLKKHHRALSQISLRTLFDSDSERYDSFHLEDCGLLLDYSKNIVQKETLTLLIKLAEAQNFASARESWAKGAQINATEERAVLHQALRAPTSKPFFVDGVDISQAIGAEREKMKAFCTQLHTHRLRGHSGDPIDTIVNIGIGGSDLGARMVCAALRPLHLSGIRTYFVSNLDAADIYETLSHCDPRRTLFLVASKSFTTEETRSNASIAKEWIAQSLSDPLAVAAHFVALSAAGQEVEHFGIPTDRMFRFWDWVGGRYSLWSSAGLSIACTIGWDHFEALCRGAHRMDKHFIERLLLQNMPLILSLLSVWYRNFFDIRTHVVVSYAYHLRYFTPFLQQLSMESNGKSVDRSGNALNYATAPIIWGGVGTDAQHSFYQLLHQGTDLASIDLIGVIKQNTRPETQRALLAHCLAQSRTLMWGEKQEELKSRQRATPTPIPNKDHSLPYRSCRGERPSNTILLQELDPETLGALIALYEHKTFSEGILWNIYSFDQWGVELGKKIAREVNSSLDGTPKIWDSSTTGLIQHIQHAETN